MTRDHCLVCRPPFWFTNPANGLEDARPTSATVNHSLHNLDGPPRRVDLHVPCRVSKLHPRCQLDHKPFGVMSHLAVLEAAGLVLNRRRGRRKHHYLNPVPIRLIHDRWVSKYRAPFVSALSELKSQLEGGDNVEQID